VFLFKGDILAVRSKLTKELDKVTSKIVRKHGRCQLAGLDDIHCGGHLQTMHIIGRANRRLRWDFMNLLCGCQGHHVYYTHHPWEFHEFIERHFPERHSYINEHRNSIKKWTLQELRDTIKERNAEADA
jgi:hypothetical protein